MSPQFKNLARLCTRCISALALTVVLGFSSLQAQEHYTWVADDDGSWMDPDNWFPRGVPGLEDEDFVIFDHDGNFTITEVPHGILLRGFHVKGTGTTTFIADQPGAIIFLGVDDPNPIFKIEKGANMIVSGVNDSKWIMSPGRRGVIEGGLIFLGSAQKSVNHQFELNEAGMLRFKPGSICMIGAMGSRFTGFPFGNRTPNNAVIFEQGSKLLQNDGGDPFGPAGVSKIVMESGSIFEFASPYETINPVLMGRKLGHFHFTANNSRRVTGAGNVDVEDFIISRGGITLVFSSGTNNMFIRGNVVIPDLPNPSTSVVRLEPSSGTVACFLMKDTLSFSGNSTFFVSSRANLTVSAGRIAHVNSNIEVSRVPFFSSSFGIVEVRARAALLMNDEYVVMGTGNFNLASEGILGIGSSHGINLVGNNTGTILTSFRSFDRAAQYWYIGSANQVTGTALPAWNYTWPRLTLVVDKSNNSSVRLSSNLVLGRVDLKNGGLDLDNRTLQIAGSLNTSTNQVFPGELNAEVNGKLIMQGSSVIEWSGASRVTANGKLELGNMRLVTGQGSGLDFGATGQPTVVGDLRINNNTMVLNNPPFYAESSRLIYANTGATPYVVGAEWTANAQNGRGVPFNIQVGMPNVSGTFLNLGTQPGKRYCNGLMRVGHPGANLAYGLEIPKNLELIVSPADKAFAN